MGLFNKDKGTTGNSGTAGSGGWTLTGTARGKSKTKAIRMEWTAPRAGRGRFAAKTRRPKQK